MAIQKGNAVCVKGCPKGPTVFFGFGNPKVTVHKCAETIQGRKLFKGGNYMRKYDIQFPSTGGPLLMRFFGTLEKQQCKQEECL